MESTSHAFQHERNISVTPSTLLNRVRLGRLNPQLNLVTKTSPSGPLNNHEGLLFLSNLLFAYVLGSKLP